MDETCGASDEKKIKSEKKKIQTNSNASERTEKFDLTGKNEVLRQKKTKKTSLMCFFSPLLFLSPLAGQIRNGSQFLPLLLHS